MTIRLLICFYFYGICFLNAQNIDKDILKIQQRMDTIESFSAHVKLEVDISFVNIPVKHARIEYAKNEETKVFSEDFVLVPKKGLDVSLYHLFKNPFITVDRGSEIRNNKPYKALNIIPTNKKTDFSIATVLIDTSTNRIIEYEVNTKKDGSYVVVMNYNDGKDLLPSDIEVQFEIERVRIPLKYMGKDAQIDKDTYKSDEPKTGKIYLYFNYTKIIY
ncbi:hypothetical protein [uncultured Algibacter sp.]|uniref:hypothetical protein n=1 Tax=uncultured Algibacter sp. TaxID=298659 RepID=UPI00260A49AB|nr:hypothetical protein [uncultured Algibacter sp.]